MPELPEVESTVRRIQPKLIEKKISSVHVFWHRTVSIEQTELQALLQGCRIQELLRRGKFIVFRLEKGAKEILAGLHLRMSGRLELKSSTAEVHEHERMRIDFHGGISLCLIDTRKFARFYIWEESQNVLQELGVEPLSDEFSAQYLQALLQGQKSCIKAFLLNQKKIAGIGNIYCDEALWKARIHPQQKAATLSLKKISLLRESIQEVLRTALEHGGTDFGDNVILHGGHEPNIYGRAGKPCIRCAADICKMTLAQRGTHFCPQCQQI
jgi:formamidopyrimidine-DNA glycosylase